MLQSYLAQTLSFFRLAPILIPRTSFNEFLVRFDCYIKNNSEPEHYDKIVAEQIKSIQEKNESIFLTSEYDDKSIPDSIAVHIIDGFIAYEKNWWYCSTEQLLEDIALAEENERIISHLVLISSPGGESYNLEKVHARLRSLNKPCIMASKRIMGSAGYYIGSAGDKVYTQNKFDIIGSIGTMISYWDAKKALEQLGYNLIEEYATKSTHKNKVSNDVSNGKPEEFIKRFLDPVQEEFESAVKCSRPIAAAAPEEAHVFNGEIFYAEEALKYGLIDGIKNLDEIIVEAHELGKEYQIRNKILIT